MVGIEAYYRPGPLLVGTEYFFQHVKAPESGDPFFHGGDAVVTWLVTGETRAYNTRGGFFNQVSPARTVFEGGPGRGSSWDASPTSTSTTAASAAAGSGGSTPMVNWHLSDQLRLEFAYGYGVLTASISVGATHFFQTRLQVQL